MVSELWRTYFWPGVKGFLWLFMLCVWVFCSNQVELAARRWRWRILQVWVIVGISALYMVGTSWDIVAKPTFLFTMPVMAGAAVLTIAVLDGHSPSRPGAGKFYRWRHGTMGRLVVMWVVAAAATALSRLFTASYLPLAGLGATTALLLVIAYRRRD